jgi:sRNA-binding carbon storage regulator CsrA
MGRLVLTVKTGQLIKVGDILFEVTKSNHSKITISISAPKNIAISRHDLLVFNEYGEMDHHHGMIEKAKKNTVCT